MCLPPHIGAPGPSMLGPGGTRPIPKRGADHLFISFCVLLLAGPRGSLAHTKLRSRSAVQSILCVAPRCPMQKLRASLLQGSPYRENCAYGMPPIFSLIFFYTTLSPMFFQPPDWNVCKAFTDSCTTLHCRNF